MIKKTALVALGLTALALLAAKLFVPSYVTSPRQERERIMRQDLLTMRAVIGQDHCIFCVLKTKSESGSGETFTIALANTWRCSKSSLSRWRHSLGTNRISLFRMSRSAFVCPTIQSKKCEPYLICCTRLCWKRWV